MALILIVDDDTLIVEMLADVASEAGHTVITAANGAVALSLARAQLPALILSDVMMPVMDGYELLQAVRNTPGLQQTLVFLMSAAISVQRSPSANAPPDGFVTKPFNLHVIEELLERLPRDKSGG